MQEWIIAMLVVSILLILRDMAKTVFSGKTKEKEEMLQKALEQIDRYPEWRQQSIDIQAEFLEKIQSLSDNQKECVERLERIEESNRKRELNRLMRNFFSLISISRIRKRIHFKHGQKWSRIRFGTYSGITRRQEEMDRCTQKFNRIW